MRLPKKTYLITPRQEGKSWLQQTWEKMITPDEKVNEKSWEEFRDCGLLWWTNMILHTFGWSIVLVMNAEQVIEAYPARVKYRGFDEKNNDDGYIKVSRYLAKNADELQKEAES